MTGDQGGTAIEVVALIALVATLVTLATPAIRGRVRGPAGDALRSAIAHPMVATPDTLRARISRVGTVALAPRTKPVVSWWRGRWSHQAATGHSARSTFAASNAFDSQACVLCADATVAGASNLVATRARSAPAGLAVHLTGSSRAFLAVATVHLRDVLTMRGGPIAASVNAEAGATAGLEGQATGALDVSREHQDVSADATAVAGARAHGEVAAAARFAGVALSQSAGGEAWAGAGATGAFHLRHDSGTLVVGGRLGAALGLGGAVEFESQVDVSGVAAQARRWSRSLEQFQQWKGWPS